LKKRKGDASRAISILLGIGMLFLSCLWVIFILPEVVSIPTNNPYPYTKVNNNTQILSNETSHNTTLEKAFIELEEANCTLVKLTTFNLTSVNANITYSEFIQLAKKNKIVFTHSYQTHNLLLIKDNSTWLAWKPSKK
jgi:hypothetical protein